MSVEDLAAAIGIGTQVVYSRDFPAARSLKGQFFRYTPFPGDHPELGLLVPIRDQAKTFIRDHPNFSSFVQDGSISVDAAASLYDRIDQMRRLRLFGGPRVIAVALIRDGEEAASFWRSA